MKKDGVFRVVERSDANEQNTQTGLRLIDVCSFKTRLHFDVTIVEDVCASWNETD